MLNKSLHPEACGPLAALVGGRGVSSTRSLAGLGASPTSPTSSPLCRPPPPPHTHREATGWSTGKGGSWLCSYRKTQASPARPVLPCRVLRGWHAPNAALHGGAASRRPGAQPWLCPPPRAAPAAAARPLRARERVSSKLEPASAAVPDSSARCGPAQMPGPPPRLRQRSMLASSAPAPAQACQAAGSCMVRDH